MLGRLVIFLPVPVHGLLNHAHHDSQHLLENYEKTSNFTWTQIFTSRHFDELPLNDKNFCQIPAYIKSKAVIHDQVTL